MKFKGNKISMNWASRTIQSGGCAVDYKTGKEYCEWIINGHSFCPYGCVLEEEE
jgi:hypothetical protein